MDVIIGAVVVIALIAGLVIVLALRGRADRSGTSEASADALQAEAQARAHASGAARNAGTGAI
ncbi:hypothetical protein ACFPER_10645 [Agromyces aurantiacus]|uniref:Pilus assembly protein n=1 Tax=Agromyces aurantiacus TaxID=165814 RepID=A0ABV9R712_9MICO|nr:hypothetical protein [Agromyces aurantiacus]MBM7503937.1 hypothetical protein [Agromyces aurantiacus]